MSYYNAFIELYGAAGAALEDLDILERRFYTKCTGNMRKTLAEAIKKAEEMVDDEGEQDIYEDHRNVI